MSGWLPRGGWRESAYSRWSRLCRPRHRPRGRGCRSRPGGWVGEGGRPPPRPVALDREAPPRECAVEGRGDDDGRARLDPGPAAAGARKPSRRKHSWRPTGPPSSRRSWRHSAKPHRSNLAAFRSHREQMTYAGRASATAGRPGTPSLADRRLGGCGHEITALVSAGCPDLGVLHVRLPHDDARSRPSTQKSPIPHRLPRSSPRSSHPSWLARSRENAHLGRLLGTRGSHRAG